MTQRDRALPSYDTAREGPRGLFFGAGVALGAVFWLAETIAHTTLFGSGAFVDEVWPHDSNELWMRSFTSLLFVISGIAVERVFARLRRSRAQARLLARAVEQTTEGVVITGPDQRIVYVNPAFTQLTGYSRAEVLGRDPSMLKSGAQDSDYYEQMWLKLSAGETWRGAIVDRRKDGRYYPASLSISPVLDHKGEATHHVAIQTDRTERAALEERLRQAEKMEALGTLVGGIAHDFNNVLAAILAHAELGALRAADPERAQRGFERIREAAVSGAEMIAQLLGFVRRRADTDLAPAEAFNLNRWITELQPTLVSVLSDQLEVAIHLPEAPVGVRMERFQLQQVLQNLLGNAADALADQAEARISLTIRTRLATTDGTAAAPDDSPHTVQIEVTDNGPGVPHDKAARIFEPFFTTKPPGQGTGLGLAMAYDIIKAAGGQLALVSPPEGGACFRITLPWAQPPAARPPAPITQAPRGAGRRVLLIDDQVDYRQTTRALLESLDYVVVEAADGAEALPLASTTPPIDLAILDITMPDLDGAAAARELRAALPELPVLFATGTDQRLLADLELPGPTFHVLAKPFGLSQLAEAAASLLAPPPSKPAG